MKHILHFILKSFSTIMSLYRYSFPVLQLVSFLAPVEAGMQLVQINTMVSYNLPIFADPFKISQTK